LSNYAAWVRLKIKSLLMFYYLSFDETLAILKLRLGILGQINRAFSGQ
jgi:hypothetical protein